MKNKILFKTSTVAIAFTLFSSLVFSGNKEGNGGDHIRGTFIKMGESVIDYLKETGEGAALMKGQGLSLDALRAALDINAISVESATLIDNGGSEVDAIGVPGKITLNKARWISYFESDSDVYYLVFHEMLRSVARNDDGYVISSAIAPFPGTRRILTRISPLIPLIDEDNLSSVVDISQIAVAGSGCPSQLEGTVANFDLERNLLDITLRRFALASGGGTNKKLDRQACNLSIPVQAPVGKRVVVSQIDLSSKIDLAQGSEARFRLESFLAGTTGVVTSRIVSAAGSPKKGRTLIRRNDLLRSKCGGADILRLNSSAVLISDTPNQSALSVGRIVVYLRYEPCN